MSQVNVSLVSNVSPATVTVTVMNQEIIQDFTERIYATLAVKAREMGIELSAQALKETASKFGLVQLKKGRNAVGTPTPKGLTAIGEQSRGEEVAEWAEANKNKADQKLSEREAKLMEKLEKVQAQRAKLTK